MVDDRLSRGKEPQVVSGVMQAKTHTKEGDTLDFRIATGELTKDQIDDLEVELFYGYGLPDNPDSPCYFVTLKSDDGTERQLMVRQFRVFESRGTGWELIAWATPELRQKLAEWSRDWPKEKDTFLDDLLEHLTKSQQ